MLSATELRKGHIIEYKGDLYLIYHTDHRTRGNLRGFVAVKMRNLRTGSMIEERFASDDRFEQAVIENREAEYSYQDGRNYVFIDPTTYEQISVSDEMLGEDARWLVEGMRVTLQVYEGSVIGVELPARVTVRVVETEPQLKTATITNVFKPARLENGITIQVPPFIENGELIEVNPREGEYLGRAAEKK